MYVKCVGAQIVSIDCFATRFRSEKDSVKGCIDGAD